ncbi:hypothetical protein D3C72_2585490 [compost metagenome]
MIEQHAANPLLDEAGHLLAIAALAVFDHLAETDIDVDRATLQHAHQMRHHADIARPAG